MVDMSAVDLTTTDVRRLSFYPIEQLLLCKERARLLMLVKQSSAESKLGKGVAKTVSGIQDTEPILISGEYYHRLQFVYNLLDSNLRHTNAPSPFGGSK